MFQDALSPAQLCGYAAFVLGVGSFLQKNDHRFKLFMTGECVAYVLHFWLLGNPTAMASSLVSTTRSVLSIYTRSVWVAVVVVAVNLGLGIGLVEHWWNWFPLIASCVGTLALFLLSGIRMRVAMLLGTMLWIANNLISGSIGGSALEIVILLVNSHTIWRMRRSAREHAALALETETRA
ncbi:MAG: YgjV family protein [Candidatus Dactylopiibacterium sp.]|nr:YgjV family protein [Candidatus Dactylopiibacterium sp.]